jgi:hypothetical protein
LGLDDETALNIPDTLTYEEIGEPIDKRNFHSVLGFYNPLAQHDSNRLECQLNLSCSVVEKHPDTSIIATLDEQGKLVLPQGEAFTPDSSVRINIVGHPEALEQVGARKLVFANG